METYHMVGNPISYSFCLKLVEKVILTTDLLAQHSLQEIWSWTRCLRTVMVAMTWTLWNRRRRGSSTRWSSRIAILASRTTTQQPGPPPITRPSTRTLTRRAGSAHSRQRRFSNQRNPTREQGQTRDRDPPLYRLRLTYLVRWVNIFGDLFCLAQAHRYNVFAQTTLPDKLIFLTFCTLSIYTQCNSNFILNHWFIKPFIINKFAIFAVLITSFNCWVQLMNAQLVIFYCLASERD